jgi:hypothetical protein
MLSYYECSLELAEHFVELMRKRGYSKVQMIQIINDAEDVLCKCGKHECKLDEENPFTD